MNAIITNTYLITKYKYVREKYEFEVEATSNEEALDKAKEYQESQDELQDVEDTSISSEFEITTLF